MAVLEMKRITITAPKSSRKRILELLQRRGVIEPDTPERATELFAKTDTEAARQTFEKNARQLIDAAGILDKAVPPEKGTPAFLAGRPEISSQEYEETVAHAAETAKIAGEILSLQKKITDCETEVARLSTQLDALAPWLDLDISMRTIGTESTGVFIGSFPEELSEGELKQRLAEALPEVRAIEVQIVSTRPQQTCAFVICHAKNGMQVEQALRSMGFAYPPSPAKQPPKERAEELKAQLQTVENEKEQAQEQIKGYADCREALLYTADYYTMRADKYRVLGELWQSPHVFQFTGYVPAEDAPALEKELNEKFELYLELDTPDEDEVPPIKLKNRSFVSAVEGVVAGYSLPAKGEIDPSAIMSIFYYILFGMMLSDAAYGILMVLVCGIVLLKFKNIELGLKKSLTMFFYCGISTTFWGVLFGGYFGDAIPVIAKTFFNKDITVPAVWFTPLDEPMRLLLFSFLLGVIHLFTGLGVQFYQLVKKKKFADALYDVVFWYFLVGGLILVLISTEMFRNMMSLSFTLPPIVGTIAAIFAGIGAVGIIATSGRESKNPGKRFLKGLYGLYGVSSWLSDILSYSRLLALGLSTGVIAQVFNQLGSMMGGGVVGAIFFTLVFLIGHTLNLGINLLGSYVHTNRLQYVEFFGKFYEGGGRKFEPFAANTKYFKFTEEK